MDNFFSKLFTSLFSSDIPILLWALVTGSIAFLCFRQYKSVRNELFDPAKRKANPVKREDREPDEDKLYSSMSSLNLAYSFFSGFTSSFPLLGMLGTVRSLIGAAQTMTGGEVAVEEFFGALTSTAWGIIFGIIFKSVVDSFLSAKVETVSREYDLYCDRNTVRKRSESK
ncbi:MAG: MotA/TolQ/ExbB proton channel family protein [Oscillospiraceae bacterium]|nr:MotA/TolQ/ExbB proton channel family protein [Oscillospiraceae bacterium]